MLGVWTLLFGVCLVVATDEPIQPTANMSLMDKLASSKYKPGDSMLRTDYESVDNALDDILRAGNVLQGRRCAIGVANLGTTDLVGPKWYIDSGVIYSAAPPVVAPRATGLTLFHKRSFYTWGTTGLMSYDVSGTDYKVAILWQVPWNTVVYNVLFNVKMYPRAVETDKNMFNQMMDYAGTKTSIGWIEKNEYGIQVQGSITDNTHAKVYVSVDASDYDPSAGPELYAECDFNAAWFGSYCWQECSPTGYCWVNKKCSTTADCRGPLQCHNACKKT